MMKHQDEWFTIEDWPPDYWILEMDCREAFTSWDQSKDRFFHNWFSNFLELRVPLQYGDLEYITAEHFYQAMKSKDQAYREAIAKCEKPNKTKFLAHKLAMNGLVREDWHEINVSVMSFAQRHKIETDPEFYDRLRLTRGEFIYEWNNWSDTFWGCSLYSGKGENMLGRILMYLRDKVYFPERSEL